MKKAIDCPGEGEGRRDLAPLYLAGKLTEEEAEAFEAHYFGCSTCREEVSGGAALRELYGKPAVAASARRAPARRTWLPLAAAAAITVAAAGVWQTARRPPEPSPPVLRSGAADGALDVTVEAGGPRSLEIAWTSRPEATVYVVQVFARDGVSVWKSESREPRLAIDVGALPSREGEALAIQVEAVDALGRVVASSELVPLQER